MSLIENYITNNGYDYFDNAAEDTLVFFVHDEDAPYARSADGDNDDDSLKGATGTMPSPDDNSNNDDVSGSVPKMALVDTKQTDAQKKSLNN